MFLIFHRSLRPLVVAIAPGGQMYLEHVKSMRSKLAEELREVISEYGPKIWEDFDEVGTSHVST